MVVVAGGIRDKHLCKHSFGVAINHIRAKRLMHNCAVNVHPSCTMHKEFAGQYCMNVDGAVSFANHASAVGIITRDSGGFAIHCRNIRLGFMSPLFTELQAILSGLHLIIDKKWSQVSMESDSKFAVEICNSNILWTGQHQTLVERIRLLLSTTETTLSFIPREANSCADWLAKNGLAQSFGSHDFEFVPRPLMSLIYFDKFSNCNHGIPPPQARAINNS